MNNSEIRARAEKLYEKIKQEKGSEETSGPEDISSLTEELQIHQVELEIQNEELMQARDKLEQAHADYYSLFDDSPLCYVILDENSLIKKANTTFVNIMGNHNQVTTGVPLSTFIHDESKAIFLGKFRSFFKNGGEFADALRFHSGSGTRYFSITGRKRRSGALKDELLLMMADVTESERSHQKLTETNKELEKFTYRVSHDLNNQARQMRSFCKLLAAARTEEREELTDYIVNLANEINTIVDGLLNLSRSSSYEIHRSTIDLSVMARDILRMYQKESEDREITIDIQPNIEIFADNNLSRILMTNLLSNAWKFTRYTEDAKITVGVDDSSSRVRVFIKDNGVGIEANHLGKLFETFTRFHNPEKYEGSGIGLATVKRIVDRHGGSIEVSSKPGEGSTFSFTL